MPEPSKNMADILWRIIDYGLVSMHRNRLTRNEIRLHLNSYWCIPPKEDAEFVAHMEDILDVYRLPHNPSCPCFSPEIR